MLTVAFVDWMMKVLTPRGLADGALRGIVFLTVITAIKVGVEITLFPDHAPPIWYIVATTYLIGIPAIAFGFVVMLRLWRLQLGLRTLAERDSLTGLLNRGAFVDSARALHGRTGAGIMLLIDADHFKKINDTWGHQVGDACLVAIGRHLRQAVRATDLVGRLGGEEFGVFLSGDSEPHVETIAARLIGPVTDEGLPSGLTLTLSVGAAHASARESFEAIYRHADEALYEAKAGGRARQVIRMPRNAPTPAIAPA